MSNISSGPMKRSKLDRTFTNKAVFSLTAKEVDLSRLCHSMEEELNTLRYMNHTDTNNM